MAFLVILSMAFLAIAEVSAKANVEASVDDGSKTGNSYSSSSLDRVETATRTNTGTDSLESSSEDLEKSWKKYLHYIQN